MATAAPLRAPPRCDRIPLDRGGARLPEADAPGAPGRADRLVCSGL